MPTAQIFGATTGGLSLHSPIVNRAAFTATEGYLLAPFLEGGGVFRRRGLLALFLEGGARRAGVVATRFALASP